MSSLSENNGVVDNIIFEHDFESINLLIYDRTALAVGYLVEL